MPLDLRTLNAAEANAEMLLNILKYIRISGIENSSYKGSLDRARAISELLDEQIHTLYDQAKEKQ